MVVRIYQNKYISYQYYYPQQMAEKKPWTLEQDQQIIHILENSTTTKWSHLAHQLAEQCGTPLRNGKECRERYLNQIEALSHKQQWNRPLEQKLVELHNQIGNKWAVIGHRMGGMYSSSQQRSDNSIKNHFYSLLRRALRKLNTVLQKQHIKQIKDFKPPILYRIVQVADQRSKQQLQTQHNFAQFSHQLKNELLDFSFKDQVTSEEQNISQIEEAKALINKVSQFITTYKKRGRRSRKNSGNNLLGSRKQKSRRINQEEVSQSEQDNQLDDIFPQVFPMFKNGNKIRKQSYASMTNQVIIEQQPNNGVRTRSRSHGNSHFHFEEKNNFVMGEEKEENEVKQPEINVNGNISEHLQISALKSGYELMEEQPVSMKKKKNSFLVQEGDSLGNKMDCQFHFFEDSGYHMRGLPQMEDGLNPEPQMDDLLK